VEKYYFTKKGKHAMSAKHSRILGVIAGALVVTAAIALATTHALAEATDENEELIDAAANNVDKGADPNGNGLFDLPLLIEAADSGNMEAMKVLLEKGANVNVRDSYGWTALMTAVSDGHPEIMNYVRYLSSAFWEKNNPAKKDHTKVAALLLEKGADVNARDEAGRTALIAASYDGKSKVVELLIEKGADVEAKSSDGSTALISAAGRGQTEVVKLLLKKGATADAKDNFNQTALMKAAWMRHPEVVKALLDKRADVNAKGSNGWTALNSAAAVGDPEVVKLLLDAGADINAKTATGETALQTAFYNRHKVIMDLLKAHGSQ
jgi:uncharacterized protein